MATDSLRQNPRWPALPFFQGVRRNRMNRPTCFDRFLTPLRMNWRRQTHVVLERIWRDLEGGWKIPVSWTREITRRRRSQCPREIAVEQGSLPRFHRCNLVWRHAARILAAFIVSSGPGDYFVIATNVRGSFSDGKGISIDDCLDRKEFRQLNIARMEK